MVANVELVLPSERFAASFLAAEQELLAAGDRDEAITAETLPAKLARWEAMRHGTLADTRVPSTSWWLVDGDEFIGRISVRHVLDERLRVFGGHIGYDVRPSRRRQGHGTRMLRMVLPFAKSMGIDPAMLTSDVTNIASRRMIEACGGRIECEFEYEGTTRFRWWLPTS
jgi:predicted acetyltransferase